jgi:PAS domain S-box-containing protein
MDSNKKSDKNQLRKKAEEILKIKSAKVSLTPSEADLLRLVHELEVHQIELELQNEELKLARERSESIAHKYTSLYDFAPIGYFTLSSEGKILELNLMGSKMLGKDRSFLKNKSFGRFIQEKELPSFNQFLENAFKSEGKQATDIMVMGIGSPPIHAQLTAIVEEDQLDHCLLIVMDITDRKKAEIELEEVVKQLHILNSQKDMFFSIIAHDLKNPFNAIIGYSELLRMEIRQNDYKAAEEFAEIILESSIRAMDLLGNLMQWAKSQTGRIIFDPKRIVLNEVVNEVTEMFDQIAIQKDVTIKNEISNEIEVLADKDMLATIVRNLVSNAVKFTHSGGEILIYTKGDPDKVILAVRDNGIGINQHDLAKLFRIDATFSSIGTKNEKGTGLGLILCKEFVEKHGGKIWADTGTGVGSTFFVSFPRKV